MLLRHLFEAQAKTAVLAFGRLNPPTIGHAKLVDAITAQDGDHYLFLSQTQKPKTDPLDFATKMKFAKQFFPGVNIGHEAVRTPVQALEKLQSLGYTDIVFIAGSDRVEGFQKLFDTYNGQPDKTGNVPFKFNSIKVVSAGERDPDADGAEGMSASKMRAAAAAGDLESFAQGAPDKKLAQTMYDAVRKGMGVKDDIPAESMQGKDKLTPNRPRNFVAKNAKMGGAGIHTDKKKAHKQGYEKHKSKDVAEAEYGIPDETPGHLPGGPKMTFGEFKKMWPGVILKRPSGGSLAGSVVADVEGWMNNPKSVWEPLKSMSEGMFGISAKEKGAIMNVVSKLSDMPNMWDHKAQTFTNAGKEELEKTLHYNPKYIKYALNLKADDFDADLESIDEASYEGNIGIMELMQFFSKAGKEAPELVAKVKDLIKQKRDKEVWKIVQDYTGTKLKGAEFEGSIAEAIIAEANYGRYYCSTDKKWKTRKGPKQSRKS